jgi:Ca2+-binding EF-hand superfamily protein
VSLAALAPLWCLLHHLLFEASDAPYSGAADDDDDDDDNARRDLEDRAPPPRRMPPPTHFSPPTRPPHRGCDSGAAGVANSPDDGPISAELDAAAAALFAALEAYVGDTDHAVTFAELMHLMARQPPSPALRALRSSTVLAFAAHDRHGNGALSIDELRVGLLQALREPPAAARMAQNHPISPHSPTSAPTPSPDMHLPSRRTSNHPIAARLAPPPPPADAMLPSMREPPSVREPPAPPRPAPPPPLEATRPAADLATRRVSREPAVVASHEPPSDGRIDTAPLRRRLGREMVTRHWNGITLFNYMDKDASRSVTEAEFIRAILNMGICAATEEELRALWNEARVQPAPNRHEPCADRVMIGVCEGLRVRCPACVWACVCEGPRVRWPTRASALALAV